MASTRVLYELVGVDRASPAFRRAGTSASMFGRTVSRVGRAVRLAGEATAAAAVAIGYESVKMATSFQASMERVHTQAGARQKDIANLSKEVLKLGTYAQQSPQELADSLYHLKSVGLDNVKAMKALKVASDFAAVGGANLEETTSAIAAAWRSGIKGAHDFGQAAGTLNAIIGAGNMRMQDLIDAMGTGFLASSRTFGVSLKSIGSALALLTDEGIPAVVAATRLRMSLSLIAAPSGAANDALLTIGLSGLKLANAMRGPDGLLGAIELLKKHLDASGLSASKQAILLSHAFGGGRSSSAILTLLNNLEVLRRKQQQINDTTSRYGDAVAQQRKTAQAQFALLRSSLDVLAVKIGSALLPPLVRFVKFLNTTALPGAVKFGKTVGHIFSSVIPVKAIENDWHELMVFLGLEKPKLPKPQTVHAADLYKFSPGRFPAGMAPADWMTNLGGLASKTNWFTNLGGVAAPQKAAQGLADRIGAALGKIDWSGLLSKAVSAAVRSAGKIGDAFGQLLSKIDWAKLGKTVAFAAVPFVISFVNNLVYAIISEAIHHPLDLVLFITSLIPIGRFATVAEKLLGEIPLLGPIVKMFTKPLAAAGKIVEGFLGRILGKIFGPVERLTGGFFAGAKNWLLSKGDDIVLGLLSGVEKRWPRLANWMAGISGRVLRFFAAAAGWLVSKGADVITGLWRGFTNKWPVAAGFIKSIPGKITSPFVSAGKWLLNTGGNIILGLLGGIRAKIAGIWQWIKGTVVDPIINAVKHWFGIRSPSTVMAGIGAHLIGGLMRGLSAANPLSIARKVFGGLPDALGAMVKKGLVAVASLPGRALRALGGLGGKALGWLARLFGGGGGGGPAMAIGQRMAAAMGWVGAQWQALRALWQGESGWNPLAYNKASGATGIPQALPGSKMASAGADWRTNPATQIRWGLGYIRSVYGSPLNAYRLWLSRSPHWYAGGTRGARPGWAWVGERGRELVRFLGGERVLSHGDSMRAARTGVPGYATGTHRLDREQRLGLSVADRFLFGNLSTVASIRHAIQQAVKAVREFYKGSQRRWRIADLRQVADRMEAKARRLAEVKSQIAAGKAYAKTVQGNLRSYAALSNVALPARSQTAVNEVINTTTTGTNIAAGLRAKLAKLRRFGAMISRLARRGLSRVLLRQIIDMGPDDGLAYGRAILAGHYIREVNRTERAIQQATHRISRHAADEVYDRGRRAGRGFLTGLKYERRLLDREMERLGAVLGRAVARWFGVPRSAIHHRTHHRAYGGWITEPVIGYGQWSGDEWRFGERGTERVTPASGGGMGGHFTGELYLDSGQFLGMVKGIIREHDRGVIRKARAGAGQAP